MGRRARSIGTVGAVKIAVEIAFQYAPRSGLKRTTGLKLCPILSLCIFHGSAEDCFEYFRFGPCVCEGHSGSGSGDWNNGRFARI